MDRYCVLYASYFPPSNICYNFDSKVSNLHCTYDWKPCEKSHGTTYSWQHVHKFCSSIHGDCIKCRGFKVNSHISKLVFPLVSCKNIDKCYALYWKTIGTNFLCWSCLYSWTFSCISCKHWPPWQSVQIP